MGNIGLIQSYVWNVGNVGFQHIFVGFVRGFRMGSVSLCMDFVYGNMCNIGIIVFT